MDTTTLGLGFLLTVSAGDISRCPEQALGHPLVARRLHGIS